MVMSRVLQLCLEKKQEGNASTTHVYSVPHHRLKIESELFPFIFGNLFFFKQACFYF